MDFLVKNKGEAREKVYFENAPGHLLTVILFAIDFDENIRVGTLREKLHAKGLEVDGSREAMIALLQQNP